MKSRTRGTLPLVLFAGAVALYAFWPDERPPPDRAPPGAGAVARGGSGTVMNDLAALLRERGREVGPVEVDGGQIVLLGGALRLSARELEGEASAHYHVLARWAQAPSASLDACVVSGQTSREAVLKEVASNYLALAFPPVLSRIKEQPLLDARGFGGTEPWGVPGYRGFAGPIGTRGDPSDASMDEAPVFADLPKLPADGQLHLLKVVLQGDSGGWRRSVELDGEPWLVTGQPWAGAQAPASPSIVVVFAVVDRPDERSNAQARREALSALAGRPSWLFVEEGCPADGMPRELRSGNFSDESCVGGRLRDCLLECERGSMTACYSAAVHLQSAKEEEPAVEPLFARSCRLGYASGCTNAAAGRLRDGRIDECGLRTFGRACEDAGDPWACTMFGRALLNGKAGNRDVERARKALGKSCLHGDVDPACAAAKEILAKLDAGP